MVQTRAWVLCSFLKRIGDIQEEHCLALYTSQHFLGEIPMSRTQTGILMQCACTYRLKFKKEMGLLASSLFPYCLIQLLSGLWGKKLPLVNTDYTFCDREQNSIILKTHLFPITQQLVKLLKKAINGQKKTDTPPTVFNFGKPIWEYKDAGKVLCHSFWLNCSTVQINIALLRQVVRLKSLTG